MRQEAAHWMLANFEGMPAADRIGVLGEWIAETSKVAAPVAPTAPVSAQR